MKRGTVVGGVGRAGVETAPQPLGIAQNGAAVATGESQLGPANPVEVAQQQVMQRQAHIRPRSATHGAIKPVVDAPSPIWRLAQIFN